MRVVPGQAAPSLYFGWRVVLALTLCTGGLLGIGLSSYIMLADSLGAELGWANSDTGTLVSAIWLTGPLVLVAAPVQRLLGAWPAIMLGMAFNVVSLALTPATANFQAMFALRLFAGLGLVLVVSSAPVIVAHWFRDRFATAMAVVWSAGAAGQMILPPIAVALIGSLGWRHAALALAAILTGATLCAVALSRGASSPADFGLLQDGLSPDAVDARGAGDHTAVEDLPWKDAIRTLNPLTAVPMCLAAFGAGAASLAFQAESPALLDRLGLQAGETAAVISAFYGAALAGSLVAGWMLDRLSATLVSLFVSISVFAPILALAAWGAGFSPLSIGLMLSLFGFALGAGEVMWITLFKRQFGAPAFATTYGVFFFSFQMGMASGGYIGGRSFEEGGVAALLAGLALLYVAPAIFSIVRPGRRNSEA